MKIKITTFHQITPTVPTIDLEPGVKKLVGLLNSKGLVTTMSCEGHDPLNGAWVSIDFAFFKNYADNHPKKLEAFLLAGDEKWHINIRYICKSHFRGLGHPRPRIKNLKRGAHVDATVTLSLDEPARDSKSKKKTRSMRALERAVARHL